MTMRSPSGFYTFAHSEKLKSGDALRYLFAFKPPGALQPGKLDDLMESLCTGPLMPDVAVVVGVRCDSSDVLKRLKTDDSAVGQERIKGRIPLVFAEYDTATGKVAVHLLDATFAKKTKYFEKVLGEKIGAWLESGLAAIFDPSVVLLEAPAGYSFQNPSGLRTLFFLKTDLALTSSSSVSFVALALFHRYFAGRKSAIDSLRVIYVDTMAIAPIAYSLLELLKLCGYDKPFEIESFHSYDGIESVPRPMSGTSLCLISASSTLSLHRKWLSEKSVENNNVVTLLSTVSDHSNEVLFHLDTTMAVEPPHDSGLSIRIKGETFLPEMERAKKVLLVEAIHRSDSDLKFLYDHRESNLLDLWRREPTARSKPRALFVDGLELVKTKEFTDWLEKQAVYCIKAATSVIVHQKDEASRQMAEALLVLCRDNLGLDGIRVLPASVLHSGIGKSVKGVVICSAVAGKGSRLLEISRALRDKHEGPRLYLVGMHVAETWAELDGLRKNLVHGKPTPHDFQVFQKTATGTELERSYTDEISRFYQPSGSLASLGPEIGARAKALGSGRRVGVDALLPFGTNLDKRMEVRPGFAYWPDLKVPVGNQAAVIGTIASILQRARESTKIPENSRLATSSYRHVLLDPENFVRYNDGIIQSALLRCALPSELDYRADHEASDFMKGVIQRCIDRRKLDSGEAVLEFIIALSSKRLQIAPVHLRTILKQLDAIADGSPLGVALRFFARPLSVKQSLPPKGRVPF